MGYDLIFLSSFVIGPITSFTFPFLKQFDKLGLSLSCLLNTYFTFERHLCIHKCDDAAYSMHGFIKPTVIEKFLNYHVSSKRQIIVFIFNN